MAVATTEAARSRLERAQQALDEALGSGTDTTRLREFRDRARDDLERLQDVEAQSAAQAEAERTQRLAQAAEVDTREQVDALTRELAAFAHVAVPDLRLPIDLRVTVHKARAYLTDAEHAHAAAQARVAGLEARMAELEQQRSAVVTRRTSGDARPSDGADLALIGADLEGLSSLLGDARSAVAAPTQRLSDARARLAHAEAQWSAAVAAARTAALLNLCQGLEAALVRAASDLYRTRGQAPYWRASGELRNVLAYGRPAGVVAA